jgi:hypothetical protein
MKKLGIVVRADDTGLGNQTHELVKMLNPEKILIIDSSTFHNKNVQHYDWYEGRNITVSRGFPDSRVLLKFFDGLSVVLSCETFYNKQFVALARKKRIKTILQYNFEFLDYMSNETLMLPDVLLAPSLWRFEEVEEKFSGRCMVKYLPPPTDLQIFKRNKEVNETRTNKLLHIGGKAAIYDRNGTNSVIDMLEHSSSDYELVIKSQTDLKIESKNKRINVLVGNEINREDMYSGYDAMILPRRYAGLCLPMNEALMSGLPVFMTDISPNNIILPGKWLSDASFVKDFMARIGIKLYEADPKSLAKVVDKYFSQNNLSNDKQEAFDIGYNNFSSEKLKESYLDLINSL